MSKIFDLVPSWIYALAVGLALTLAGGNYVMWKKTAAEFATFRAEVAEAGDKAEKQNRKREQELNAKLQRAQTDSRKREATLRADADGARTERDGLRNDIDAGGRGLPSASRSSLIERATTLGELLDQCSAAFTNLAGKADRHANDARLLLDGWPK